MAGIFTRPELAKIINDEALDADERINRIMSLRGRDLDDGYVSKSAAKAAQDSAIEQAKSEWEKNLPKPDPKESAEYKALQGEYAGYKAMQEARGSDDFKDVKGKFFDMVYGMIDRADGAKPVKEQLATIRSNYEEYFAAQQQSKPNFGAPTEGSMPKGETGAAAGFADAWGFVPKNNK
jgi:hypothetical protein